MSLAARAVTAGFGAYLLYAYATGALYFYIHPIYVLPTVATGLILLALAAAAGRGTAGPSGHEGRSGPLVALLVLPLVAGFALPPQPLSLQTVAQRGVEVVSLGSGESSPEFDVSLPPDAYTIKDWLKAFQANPEPGRHAGKPVRVTGFVYREARLPRDWFLVARFVVKCCAVDAQPVGLPVRAADRIVPEPGRWVTVEGAWEVGEADGQRRAVIAPRAITPIARPEQPYLY